MGGTRTGRLRQGLTAIAVLTIHVAILTVATRPRYSQPSARAFVSTWIQVPTAPPPRLPSSAPLLRSPASIVNPIKIEPPEIELVPIPPEVTGRTIDWAMEAERAAAAISNAPTAREFGSHREANSQQKQQHPAPAHQVGEGYRDPYGNTITWVSDKCYIVSERAVLGTPDVLARSRPTYTTCVDTSAPEGELFKELPAYKKLHPK